MEPPPFDIVTCCNDARLPDLKRFLNSLARLAPEARLRVIPFDDQVQETVRLVRSAGGRMMERDPLWTALGRRLYGERGVYRPGVPCWQYFSKLNMFNQVQGPTLYLDVNCVLLSVKMPGLGGHELLFHSRARKGRNIRNGAGFIRRMAPEIGEGFNLGHCLFGPRAARVVRQFAEVLPAFHGRYLGPAPEQAFLTYAMAFCGLKAGLLHDLDDGIAPTNSSGIATMEDAEGVTRYAEGRFQGLRLVSVKRPGTPGMCDAAQRVFSRFD